MNRAEYISQLEFSLKGKLPPREINEILRDYSEYFEAGKSEGKTEEEIAINLGIPSLVAEQILSENEEEAPKERRGLRYYWNRLIEKIKAFLEKPSGTNEPQEGAVASFEGNEPQKKEKIQKQRVAADVSIIKTLLVILVCLLALPLAALLIPAGLALVAGLIAAVLGLGMALVVVFGAFLFCAVVAAMLLASLAVGTVSLPGSFVVLGIFGILLCLSGAALSICLVAYLIRFVVRLIRGCFGRAKNPNSARNPAYQAMSGGTCQQPADGYGGVPYGEEAPSSLEDEEDYEEEERNDA